MNEQVNKLEMGEKSMALEMEQETGKSLESTAENDSNLDTADEAKKPETATEAVQALEMTADAVLDGTKASNPSPKEALITDIGNLEGGNKEYNENMNRAKQHADKAQSYKNKARRLESDLRQGKVESSKAASTKHEISRLKSLAEKEENEARKYRNAARKALQNSVFTESELNAEHTLENASVYVCRASRTPQYY